MKVWQQQAAGLEKEVMEMAQDLEKYQYTWGKSQKDAQIQKIQKKRAVYDALVQKIYKQAGERQNQLLKPIMKIINQIGRAGNYTLIIDKSTMNVVYIKPGNDVTAAVLKQLVPGRKSGR